MPGGKCKASRLPEGRSRKHARQRFEQDDEECRGERGNEQRRRRSGPTPFRASAQALWRCRQRWHAMRGRRRGAVVTRGAVMRRRPGSLRDRCAEGSSRRADSSFRDGATPGGGRGAVAVWMPQRSCSWALHRRGRRSGCTGRRRPDCCRNRLRDGLGHLGLGICHGCANRRGRHRRRCGHGGRGRRGLLRHQCPRGFGHGGVCLLQQLRGRGGAWIGVCERRSGEDSRSDRRNENAETPPGVTPARSHDGRLESAAPGSPRPLRSAAGAATATRSATEIEARFVHRGGASRPALITAHAKTLLGAASWLGGRARTSRRGRRGASV
jgi:hypothetical protein